MAEHTVGYDRERSLRDSGSRETSKRNGDDHRRDSNQQSSSSQKRSTRNWKNITTHVQVVERMKKTSISNREQSQGRTGTGKSEVGVIDASRSSREKSSSSKSRQSSIRFSDQSEIEHDLNQRSKSRHGEHKRPQQNSYEGYYQQQPTSKVSLSSALDEIMMDMSSISTIVECYCGQNSCSQCNLLLKMAGSDG